MNDLTAQKLALTVIAAIEKRLAEPDAVPPAARRIGALLGEIAADIHHLGVRAGVKRLVAALAPDACTSSPDAPAARLIP